MNNQYNNKKYYWMKLERNFFKDARIKKLRRIAGGDTFTIIYLELLLLSLETNGLLIFEGIENTFEEEMASKIDEFDNLENVKITISWLISEGILIPQEEGDYQFTRINVGKETQSNIYKKDKKVCKLEKFQQNSNNSWKNSIEKEKELEKEKDIELENNIILSKDNILSVSINETNLNNKDLKVLLDYFNNNSKLKNITAITEKRKSHLISRFKQYGINSFKKVVDNCANSPFLQGQNKKGWIATFDWLILPNNYVKVLEGNYNSSSDFENNVDRRVKDLENAFKIKSFDSFDDFADCEVKTFDN